MSEWASKRSRPDPFLSLRVPPAQGDQTDEKERALVVVWGSACACRTGSWKERALIRKLDETLTRLSGHKGEGGRVIARDAVSGLPQ